MAYRYSNQRGRPLSYQAKSNGDGTYTVLLNGTPVTGATVQHVYLAPIASHRFEGGVHYVAGSVATITVPGASTEFENVPVVFLKN